MILWFRIYDTETFFYDPKDRPDFDVLLPLNPVSINTINPDRVQTVGSLYKFLDIPYCQNLRKD